MTELTRLVNSPGASSLPYVDPMFPNRPLVLHVARPRQYDAATPVLFVHHGVNRNGAEYRDYWLDLVDEACILAISIEFPEASFPEYLWYNSGNLHAKDSTPNPRETWTFGIDERLFEELRARGITIHQSYGLFGHSAGGQYVHRMFVLWISRPRCRRRQRQCRHLRNAGSGDTMAVWPRRDQCRYRRTARIACLSNNGDGGH